tara:strand:+ start:13 stop:528 length:516 start_codon:yes stop_codon:yes gene_type:complete
MIQKHEAQLATLSIDIQAIRVNGKRMTLAAFKQLKEGHYSNEKKPNCKIWGMVRYKLDKDDDGDWVVHSLDGTLYRRKTPLGRWDARKVFKTEDGDYRVDGENMPIYYWTNGYYDKQRRGDYFLTKEEIEIKYKERKLHEVYDNKLEEAQLEVQRKDYRMAKELPHLFIAV